VRIDISFSISLSRERPEQADRETQLDALVDLGPDAHDAPRIGFRSTDPGLRR
jgi:hypothetical protein